jgi:osmotically-inducible protein OsmY
MADWNRQDNQRQDWSERQQSARREIGLQDPEWRQESQRSGQQGYGSDWQRPQAEGSQRVYGPQGYGQGTQGYGSQAHGRQGYGQGSQGYGGQDRSYGGYGSQSGYGRQDEPGSYSGQQAGELGYGQGSYGGGQQSRYRGYGSPTGYGANPQSGYGQQGRMQRRGPKGYKRSDERIREDVCERLMQSDVDASEVTVEVRDGRVILQGSVPERRMKHTIEDVADQCSGVNEVENNIRVARQDSGSSWSGRSGTEYEVDGLNRCLRSELSAIETYRQALDRDRQQYGGHGEFQRLSEILSEHEDAASRLRQSIRRAAGEPSTDSGAWGTWSKIVMGAAKLFGDKAALKALKEGEESGLAEYQRYQREFAGSDEDVRLTSELMNRQQRHIRELDGLIAAAG